MIEAGSLHGLSCPKCGGMVPIPEGQLIVKCPFCDLRSFVRGERGVLHYQVPNQISRQDALDALRKFLSGNMAIAPLAKGQSKVLETFVVYLPFWTVWSRVAAWVFGEEKVGSGDHSHYEPREIRVVQEMTWNGAACDVGEFGVVQIPPISQDLQPFNSSTMHATGMVFEPVNSFSDARQAAENQFQGEAQRRAGLDRLSQLFVRTFHNRNALVYHPLWVVRYQFRGRAFQVVVDGFTGKVLFGKAPGNTLYRAARLVFGMAAGAFLALDIPALIIGSSGNNSGSGTCAFAFGSLALGVGLMFAGYRAFRHGEQFEFRLGSSSKLPAVENPLEMVTSVKEIEKWVNLLS